jgi:mono/diheme cytochrome c family protein
VAPAALQALLATAVVAALLVAVAAWRELGQPEIAAVEAVVATAPADQVARGRYLAQVGNCAGCHTLPGAPAYAGGRGIPTPFGTVYASNLTPDPATGLGRWSAEAFWRALHAGVSRDGRLLLPAFPYANTTHVTREDSDALYAYLRSLPPVAQPNRAHALRFPYDTALALAAWRTLFFRQAEPGAPLPAELQALAPAVPAERDAWARGAYLVRGLGHCSACHAPRNGLGAGGDVLQATGGMLPGQNWYAPSLRSAAEAGVGDWPLERIVALLTHGVADAASTLGPMAEVVAGSTQHLAPADATAMAHFLRSLGQPGPAAPRTAPDEDGIDVAGLRRLGGERYRERCADCHGEQGEGRAGAYPALAGNRALTMDEPANLVQAILHGGFPPSTAGNPRPFGMPPFAIELDDANVAAVATFLRSAWGHQAPAVSPLTVQRLRHATPPS